MENISTKMSVIVPAYNVQQYISRCIESIATQTLKEIEIIIVNDASTDNTLEIIKKIKDERIIIIDKEKNEGLSAARNSGIRIAKGEYILHIDGDDWIEQNYLSDMFYLAKKENADIVISDYYIDYNNSKLVYVNDFKNGIDGKNNIEILEQLFSMEGNTSVWNKLIKRELYRKNDVKFINGIALGEDLAVIPRLLFYSEKTVKLNKAYLHYIQNPKSITKVNDYKKLFQICEVLNHLEEFFKNNKLLSIDLLKVNHLSFGLFYNSYNFKDKNYVNILNNYFESVEKVNINKIKIKKIRYIVSLFKIPFFRNKLIFSIVWKLNKMVKNFKE